MCIMGTRALCGTASKRLQYCDAGTTSGVEFEPSVNMAQYKAFYQSSNVHYVQVHAHGESLHDKLSETELAL